MDIDRTATKQEIDRCLSIMETQMEEDDRLQLWRKVYFLHQGYVWRDADFCRQAVAAYRIKLSPSRKANRLSGLWLLLGMALSSSVVISALYLIVRFA